ncbi:MAG: orotate phosphoribosyltransferase [Clostridia bacterium]|jgi:orotate phosphoribosyltransferase|nr:orotate phosphoribosyltransferase [Clostridia bacterium]
MEQYKKEFIEFMVQCDVITFGDFVTKSGRKTPFFINTGNFKTGAQMSKLGEFYAKSIKQYFTEGFEVLFGPAYKGIPLSVATAIALNNLFNIDIVYCSNRKEIKDHGDKGILMGGKPKDGDRVVIIEDVTTAGTSIHETMPILKAQGDVEVLGLIISVDRMERGTGEKSAFQELQQQYGLKTRAIVTMQEVVEHLHNKEFKGKIIIDDVMKQKIEEYYKVYGA